MGRLQFSDTFTELSIPSQASGTVGHYIVVILLYIYIEANASERHKSHFVQKMISVII